MKGVYTRPRPFCPRSVFDDPQRMWYNQFQMGANICASLLSSTSVWPHPRKPNIGMIPCCRNDSHQGIPIDQIHLVDSVHFLWPVLNNAEPVDPEVALPNVCGELHSILDDHHNLVIALSEGSRYFMGFEILKLCAEH